MGGVVVSIIACGLLSFLCYRQRKRNRLQHEGTTEWKSELSSETSALGRSRNDGVHEMHGEHRPNEIDSNALVECPPGIVTSPLLYEMSASRE